MTKNQQLLAKIGGCSLVLLSFLAVGQQVSAITFVSNLDETTTNLGGISFDFYQGSSFTTGNSSYALDSVSIIFREQTNSSNFFLRLYSDNGGVPDTILTSFTATAPISGNIAVNDFTPDNLVQLVPNTPYWLISGIAVDDGGLYDWGAITTTNQTGIDGWTISDGRILSTNQGMSWFAEGTLTYQFSVDATDNNAATTPESSSLVALLGLGGLALGSRFKKQK